MRVRLCRSDVLGMSEAAAPVTKPLDSCRTQKFSSSSRPLRGRQRAGLAAGPGVRSVFQFGELVVSAVGACGKGFGIARDANACFSGDDAPSGSRFAPDGAASCARRLPAGRCGDGRLRIS